MSKIPQRIDIQSISALEAFNLREKDRANSPNHKPKRLLLHLVKDEYGNKHLECKEEKSSDWKFKDTLTLIFTNKYWLRSITNFIASKDFETTASPDVKEALHTLKTKAEAHNKKPLSLTIKLHLLDEAIQKIHTTTQHIFSTPEQEPTPPSPLPTAPATVPVEIQIASPPKPPSLIVSEDLGPLARPEDTSIEELEAMFASIEPFSPPTPIRNQFQIGLSNPGNACYINSVTQGFRASPLREIIPHTLPLAKKVEQEILDNPNDPLHMPLKALLVINTLPKQEEIYLLDAIIDVINTSRDRIEEISKLNDNREFANGVRQVLKLPQSDQERFVDLIITSADPTEFKEALKTSTLRANEQAAILNALESILKISDEQKTETLFKLTDITALAEKRRTTLSTFMETITLTDDTKLGIEKLIQLKSEQRELLCKGTLLNAMDELFTKMAAMTEGEAVDGSTVQLFRQLIRLSGLDARSGTSQEDAALLCQTVLETIGYEKFNYKMNITGYEFPHPVRSLENQTGNANVVSLAISQAPTDTTVADLVNKNKVTEVIDPESVANTDGLVLSDDEKTKLKSMPPLYPITTQQLVFEENQTPPKLLPIVLKRYEMQPDGSIQKIDREIKEAHALEVEIIGEELPAKYTLAAVVVHAGATTDAGHYYTYAPTLIDGNQAWIEYNDSRVTLHKTPDSIDRVTTDIRKNGYIHFYGLN